MDEASAENRIAALEAKLRDAEQRAESLALAHSQLQAAMEATADGLLIVDHAGKVSSCNRRFIELWRIPEALLALRDDDKLLGYVLEQLTDPAAFIAKVRALYDSPLQESYDVLEFKDGRFFERYSRPQLLAGQSVGRVWSFRDATERRRTEEEAVRTRAEILRIEAQAATLAELSTPLIPISDTVMVMPLIGAIDATRASRILETLLDGVSRTQARIAIIDITGVSVVDTHVAGTLVRAAQAVKLLGARVLLTGIRAEVAQTLIGLGTDLGEIVTRGTLQSGIAYALSGKHSSGSPSKS